MAGHVAWESVPVEGRLPNSIEGYAVCMWGDKSSVFVAGGVVVMGRDVERLDQMIVPQGLRRAGGREQFDAQFSDEKIAAHGRVRLRSNFAIVDINRADARTVRYSVFRRRLSAPDRSANWLPENPPMIEIDSTLKASDLRPAIDTLWEASARKILAIDEAFGPGSPTPVVTREGVYQPQGWTEWTQGFQHGSAALQFDATGDERFLNLARERTIQTMASHVTHIGVHDHGFNNVSTYGNLLRLALEVCSAEAFAPPPLLCFADFRLRRAEPRD